MEIDFGIHSCRVCLKNVGVIPLFKRHENQTVAEMISSLCNINIICNEVLPDTVCKKCLEIIEMAINTKAKIINSEIVLNTYLESNKTITEPVGKCNETSIASKLVDLGGKGQEESSQASEESLSLQSMRNENLDKNIQSSFTELLSMYQCETCKFNTDTYKKLIFHMRFHADIKLYECEHCGNEYKAKSKYLAHSTVHRLVKQFKCNICSKSFKGQPNLDQHLLIHKTERNIPCPYCDKQFCHMKGLRSHLLSHNERNVVCATCGKQFKHSTFLKIHEASIHGNPKRRIKKRKLPPTYLNPTTPCEFCGQILSIRNVQKHIDVKHIGKRQFKCSYCEKTFTTSESLQAHMQCHVNSKIALLKPETMVLYLKYKCDQCDKAFTSSFFLKKHKVYHSGLKEHACPHCGKKFAFKSYLERHVRLNHDKTNPRNFVCGICGKVSTDSSGLKAHLVAHTGETPYHCKFCDAKFSYAKSLRIHISSKHKSKVIKVSDKSSKNTLKIIRK